MKLHGFLLVLAVLLSTSGKAQNCLGVPLKTGQSFEMSMFNAKDKPTGKVTYQVTDMRREGSQTLVDITVQMTDEKGRQQAPYTVRYTCTGSELLADLSGLAQTMQNAGMKDTQIKLKTNQLVYPGQLTVGQKLSDGQMEADMITNGSNMMEMSLVMSNRQVEAQQPVTTPAGTFNAYKISSDLSLTNRVMGMPIRSTMRVVSYRTTDQLLDIRSETYNKSGKLMAYTLLSRVN
ncbi:hypothetical protein GGR92_001432 [Spirosoma lacussanchae]|uniref:TapB family protein n=1 Tax=Spirosoma lacussanchae TaxID=1884249 RepID=UPI00110811FE|nr:hypothetical protein [Spirosoma lacussanchae]